MKSLRLIEILSDEYRPSGGAAHSLMAVMSKLSDGCQPHTPFVYWTVRLKAVLHVYMNIHQCHLSKSQVVAQRLITTD